MCRIYSFVGVVDSAQKGQTFTLRNFFLFSSTLPSFLMRHMKETEETKKHENETKYVKEIKFSSSQRVANL